MTEPGKRVSITADIAMTERGQAHLADLVTIIMNKPVGIVSTQPEGSQVPAWQLLKAETCVNIQAPGAAAVLAKPWTCSVCGRLDRDSRGMLILSQDGKLARLITGTHTWTKQYRVTTDVDPAGQQIAALQQLRRLDHQPIKMMEVRRLEPKILEFVLQDGRKHQIRRACEAVGLNVTDLLRIRIGPWTMDNIPEGHWRVVARDAVQQLVGSLDQDSVETSNVHNEYDEADAHDDDEEEFESIETLDRE